MFSRSGRPRLCTCSNESRLLLRQRGRSATQLRGSSKVSAKGRRARMCCCPSESGTLLQGWDGCPNRLDESGQVVSTGGTAEKRYGSKLLGVCYLEGKGVPKDRGEAIKLWRAAADEGLAEMQCWMAFSYEQGAGVPQDKAQAREYYRKAAEQGNDDWRRLHCALRWRERLGRFFRGRWISRHDTES